MGLNNKKHLGFVLAIFLVLAVLGSFIYYQEVILQNGETTILRTRPIDPRDLLRGEYVILRYALATDKSITSLASTMPTDGEIYIGLTEDGDGVASVSKVSLSKDEILRADDLLLITGTVDNGRVSFPTIEQYFVPEGAGKSIERMGSEVRVEVVLMDGHVRIKQLLDANLQPINPDVFLEEK